MNDGILVEALRDRDPGALAALYDTYAESIYQYCRAMLGSPDGAQVALRDTFVSAEALIGSLNDPENFRPWLYALARGECRRRLVPGDQSAAVDTGPVSAVTMPLTDPADADLRVVAWSAVAGLDLQDREVLELTARHGLSGAELASVLGTGQRYAEALREAATERLRDAVTAEILVRGEPHGCDRLVKILIGFDGVLSTELRDRVIRHRAHCEICSRRGVKQVSAAKVFGMLPEIALPGSLRVRVLSCFIDPELVPYRRFVARRVGPLDISGFPREGIRGEGRVAQAIAGSIATLAAVAAVALMFAQLFGGPEERLSNVITRRVPTPSEAATATAGATTAPPEKKPVIIMPVAEDTRIDPVGPRELVAAVPGMSAGPQPAPAPLPAPSWSRPPVPHRPPTWPTRPSPRPSPPPVSPPVVTPTPPHTPPPTPTEPTVPPTPPVQTPTPSSTFRPHPPREHERGHHHPRPRREREPDCEETPPPGRPRTWPRGRDERNPPPVAEPQSAPARSPSG
jgi:DNA-directed RNA polymerase specialized sigma24 family protein